MHHLTTRNVCVVLLPIQEQAYQLPTLTRHHELYCKALRSPVPPSRATIIPASTTTMTVPEVPHLRSSQPMHFVNLHRKVAPKSESRVRANVFLWRSNYTCTHVDIILPSVLAIIFVDVFTYNSCIPCSCKVQLCCLIMYIVIFRPPCPEIT